MQHHVAHSVGILCIELYTPNTCVLARDLEQADGVSQGKYTIGLGQVSIITKPW